LRVKTVCLFAKIQTTVSQNVLLRTFRAEYQLPFIFAKTEPPCRAVCLRQLTYLL